MLVNDLQFVFPRTFNAMVNHFFFGLKAPSSCPRDCPQSSTLTLGCCQTSRSGPLLWRHFLARSCSSPCNLVPYSKSTLSHVGITSRNRSIASSPHMLRMVWKLRIASLTFELEVYMTPVTLMAFRYSHASSIDIASIQLPPRGGVSMNTKRFPLRTLAKN